MRMKRFTAWAVSLVMLFSALPVQALADTTYAQDFYLVPGSDAAEDMFRRAIEDAAPAAASKGDAV